MFLSNSTANSTIQSLLISLVVIITVGLGVFIAVLAAKERRASRAIKIMRNKVEAIARGDKPVLAFTKSDEINKIMLEIDALGKNLSGSLKLLESEKQNLTAVMDNANFVVLAIEYRNRILLKNKIADKYFYIGAELQHLGQTVRDIRFLKKVANVAKGKRPNAQFDFYHSNGEILEVKVTPVQSKTIKLLITMHPVTAERKLQKEKHDFFINASHELSSPLSAILGYSEMLLSTKKPNEQIVKTIYEQADRMKSLIDNMLSLSRIENRDEDEASEADIKEVIEKVILTFLPKISEQKIKLEQKLESAIISASDEKIFILVSNLIDNSIKYSKVGGRIKISLTNENNKISLRVKDYGIGIKQKDLTRVFERYYRTEEGRASPGTGLGLSIVKHICNLYGAKYTINSEVGFGTEIEVQFFLIM